MSISEEAHEWAKRNEKIIIEKFAGNTPSVDEPVSFFMAGSPGAGKTEYSRSFIKDLNKVFREKYGKDYPIVRIDADELRCIFDGYDGSNSSDFQRASVLGVNKLHDYALKNKINFLLDGTFANKEKAIENIKRSIKHGRKIQIFYLYQDPLRAWELTRARQEKEGRVVPVDVFIKDYFLAKDVVNEIKQTFNEKVKVDLIIRDYIGDKRSVYFNVGKIDNHLKIPYNEQTLREKILGIST